MFLFTARKKSVDFQRYVRRLIDLTGPTRACSTGIERSSSTGRSDTSAASLRRKRPINCAS